MHRRDFLRLMGARLRSPGFGACTKQPIEKIVPYVKQPEEIVPGKPLRFASATTFGGYGQGIIVTSYEGRPTKIEGNPDHPASLGATTSGPRPTSRSLRSRSRASGHERRRVSTWGIFFEQLNSALVRQQVDRRRRGSAFSHANDHFAHDLDAQLQNVLKEIPASAKWHPWEPLTRDALGDGNALRFREART